MPFKLPPTPLPAIENLPASPFEHPVIHRVVGLLAKGCSQKAVAAKTKLEPAYIKALLAKYLR